MLPVGSGEPGVSMTAETACALRSNSFAAEEDLDLVVSAFSACVVPGQQTQGDTSLRVGHRSDGYAGSVSWGFKLTERDQERGLAERQVDLVIADHGQRGVDGNGFGDWGGNGR